MTIRLLIGDCRELLATLPEQSVQCCITSPPYFGLRDYGVDGQIGLEPTVDAYVAEMVGVFRQVWRVLRDDGTLWLNLGDSYCSQGGDRVYGSHDGAVGRANAPGFRPGSGRADGIVDERGQRNRNGVHAQGLKPKDLIGIPWRVAFALQADGWYLRSDIIWSKSNPMPESVRDRPTKAHEYLFLLSKRDRYYYDADAVRTPLQPKTLTTFGTERKALGDDSGLVKADNWARDVPQRKPRMKIPGGWDTAPGSHGTIHRDGRTEAQYQDGEYAGANMRSVWTIATHPFPSAHFATFPPALVEPCVKAGSREGDTVLDPFGGAGTTGLVADRLGRDAILIELNPDYAAMAERRIRGDAPLFADVVID